MLRRPQTYSLVKVAVLSSRDACMHWEVLQTGCITCRRACRTRSASRGHHRMPMKVRADCTGHGPALPHASALRLAAGLRPGLPAGLAGALLLAAASAALLSGTGLASASGCLPFLPLLLARPAVSAAGLPSCSLPAWSILGGAVRPDAWGAVLSGCGSAAGFPALVLGEAALRLAAAAALRILCMQNSSFTA